VIVGVFHNDEKRHCVLHWSEYPLEESRNQIDNDALLTPLLIFGPLTGAL
jgi:hypothetical protein